MRSTSLSACCISSIDSLRSFDRTKLVLQRLVEDIDDLWGPTRGVLPLRRARAKAAVKALSLCSHDDLRAHQGRCIGACRAADGLRDDACCQRKASATARLDAESAVDFLRCRDAVAPRTRHVPNGLLDHRGLDTVAVTNDHGGCMLLSLTASWKSPGSCTRERTVSIRAPSGDRARATPRRTRTHC